MPLADLIRQFNREATLREGQASAHGLLLENGNSAAALVDGWLLDSLFAPVVDPLRRHVVGHEARLGVDGRLCSLTALFSTLERGDEVVAIDRLVRTLHSLNFLAQRRATGGFLYLDVHPRHLENVTGEHGLVFEAILKRCGLSPDDIVLQIDAAAATRPQVIAALGNYRRRGYGLALNIENAATATLPAETLVVDLVKVSIALPESTLSALADAAKGGGSAFAVSGVGDAEQLDLARRIGADLIFAASAASFCFPTHQALSLQETLRIPSHSEGGTP